MSGSETQPPPAPEGASEGPELTGPQLGRLLEVGRSLVSELDLEAVLHNVLEAARDLTQARYAALGILDRDKRELERFVFVGIDETTRHAIGPLPRGRGVLGELIRHPVPLRLPDVNAHEHSYGFPANHPPMKSFLGAPVLIRNEAWGNLYLTEKSGGGEFTEGDESLVVVLAAWAAVAIENARLYEGLDRRRAELERIQRGLEMSADISRAAASGLGLGSLLELICKRGRSLVDAEVALVLVAEGDGLVVAGAAGEGGDRLMGMHVGGDATIVSDLGLEAQVKVRDGVLSAPLPFRGRRRGLLAAIGGPEGVGFSEDDQRLFDSYAISAATTIASVRTAEAEKVKLSIEASERERRRWARELHDETLQELGALRFLLETATRGTAEQTREASERALAHVDRGIANLQGLITELRPASLDELGVGPALEALARDAGAGSQAKVEATVRLAHDEDPEPPRLAPELENTIYRLVQEGVNNALKHSGADLVRVEVVEADDNVSVTISDDGAGFDPTAISDRFGLLGMRERVALAGGELTIESESGAGTVIRANLPVPARGASRRQPARRG